MAKQDEWTRITLRIPPELHARLIEAAATKSLNAEIIERLERSLRPLEDYQRDPGAFLDALEKLMSKHGYVRSRSIEGDDSPKG